MPENTDHPTQKPEKLIAKLVLASSQPGSVVFDPFLGSGTTAVVCKKLGRRFVGVEQNTEYCCWTKKRLGLADLDPSIQGYADGVFWERNSLAAQKADATKETFAASPNAYGPSLVSTQMAQKLAEAPRPRGRPRLIKPEPAEENLSLFEK